MIQSTRGLAAAAVLLTLSACADLGAIAHLPTSGGARAQPVAPLAHSFAHASVLGHVGVDASALEPHLQMPDVSGSAPEIIRGAVSWYGPRFAGRRTANGEIFDPRELTMAHRKLPFNTWVRVTNPDNGASVVVRVNDRGPYVGDRVADLSHAAAQRIGMVKSGVIAAELEILSNEEAIAESAGRGPALVTAPGRAATLVSTLASPASTPEASTAALASGVGAPAAVGAGRASPSANDAP